MIRLWAPHARVAEVETLPGGERRRLRAELGGWWCDVADYTGAYWLVVDGRRLADPRSTWQPQGLEGPSHAPSTTSFAWSDGGWRGFELGDAVIYEAHVGTFSDEGTYDGIRRHLDHLHALGINALELMPINTFPGDHGWGYDGALLYAPHHTYGDPESLRALVDACHATGIAVILDVVYNHLGPTGNHLATLGPYFTDFHPTPWGKAVNLDRAGSDEVRRFVIDNALQWVGEFHIDGLRVDAVHALHDESAIHILEELAAEVHALGSELGRTVWVIAESDLNDPRLVRTPAVGGYGLDAAWSDDFHHAIHVALTGEDGGYYADYGGWPDVARALERVWVYDGRYSPLRQRRHGRPAGDVPRRRFLGYSQNHDQIGNRACGERLCHLVDRRRVEMAAALVLTAPFVPMLFQGEEWAATTPFQFFTDHRDPAIAESVRDGRRQEFAGFAAFAGEVPDPQDPATFRRSKLDWTEREAAPHRGVLDWYRRLIGLRRTVDDLRSDGPADTIATVDAADGWLRVRRGSAIVAGNVGDAPVEIRVDGGLEVALTNDAATRLDGGNLTLSPWATAVCLPPGPR